MPRQTSRLRHHRLPDGTRVLGPSRLELRFLYREIFVEQTYLAGDIAPGGCVVDVGAHVGLFGLWAARHLDPSRLLLVEPIPALFAALDDNAERLLPDAERLHLGLAREAGAARFRYYPQAAGWSSRRPREDQLRESLFTYLQRGSLSPSQRLFKVLGRIAPRLQRAVYDRICERLFASAVDLDCPVTTLSEVIEDRGLDRIDLLKLDVEGSELDVLEGVRREHWSRIRAITAEVEDIDGALDRARTLLEGHGLSVRTGQTLELSGTPYHHLWAATPSW